MSKASIDKKISDVPTQVFEEFLISLSKAKVADDVVARFRQVLLQDKNFTDLALKNALFGKEQPL